LQQLTPQQRAQFDSYGCFSVDVVGRGTFYIFPRRAFNVVHTPSGDCYCCTPEQRVPVSDLMLSQKLLLETDPEQFFSVANRKPNFVIDLLRTPFDNGIAPAASPPLAGLFTAPGTTGRPRTNLAALPSRGSSMDG
jgi:hypothetical protein